MATIDLELMSQMKQIYERAAASSEGDESQYAALSLQSQAAQPGLNANAATFVPGRYIPGRFEEYGYFPPPHGTPEAWLHILDIGMLASDPTLAPLLVESCSWSSDKLRDLAQLFCWEILAKANIVDFGPEAAFFARKVHDTLATDDSEWLSSYFASHLQQYALKHFKSFWCSLVSGIKVSF